MLQAFKLQFEPLDSEDEVGRVWHRPSTSDRLYAAIKPFLNQSWYSTQLHARIGLERLETAATQPGLKPIVMAYIVLAIPFMFV